MPVELLVQQPGREHLRMLHPHPRGHTTWFNKSSNSISNRINQMMYSMFRKGYPTYSVVHAEDHELWFRQFAEAYTNKKTGEIQNHVIKDIVDFVETQKEAYLASQQPISDDSLRRLQPTKLEFK
ncbi:unnamed protein product [Brassica rapa]|uniref:Uncharacterized protein n=1 Tax=Brassica campestris TaxID=3711 RepID=A0A3P5Z8L9_BRACM|nr:unnamed protein product [Brassica rapa]VDC76636.1 unnamed protein product [Brassica rapa]